MELRDFSAQSGGRDEKNVTNAEVPGVPRFLEIFPTKRKTPSTRWWFQIFFIFTPTWGNDPF